MRGETLPAQAAARTKCPSGHALDGRKADGSRYCLTCNRSRNRTFYQSNQEAERERSRRRYRDARAALEDTSRGTGEGS